MIILYNPRAAESKHRLPISVLSLAAVFEGTYPWQLVDGNVDQDAGNTILQMLEADPSIRYLLVTVMPGPQLSRAVPHTRAVKARFPHVTVIWGGYFPTSHTEVVMADPAIDYVVRNQGEETIMELLAALEGGRAAGRHQGPDLAQGRPGGQQPQPRPGRPQQLPGPALREGAMCPLYLGRTILGTRTISYHSSQGCPFTCSFCAVTKTYWGRWLPEKVERTLAPSAGCTTPTA